MKALFDLVRGPVATTATGATMWRGLLVVAVDGTLLSVADSLANLRAFAKHRLGNGVSGYPQIRPVALAREVYHHLTSSFSPVEAEAKSPTT
jgi:hypothetical protein